QLLAQVRDMGSAGSAAPDYGSRLAQVFEAFPDTHEQLRRQDLAFYRFALSDEGAVLAGGEAAAAAAPGGARCGARPRLLESRSWICKSPCCWGRTASSMAP
ncbi:hypothetical protein ABXL43_38655, partial [Burkholderia sola]